MMMKPALLIMAAGLGSRYGSMKQVEAVGPSGENLMDYSIYDALRAGVGRIVFVLNKNADAAFKQWLIRKYQNKVDIDFAVQEYPEERNKPWGTGHAVLTGAKKINRNFMVINADDFYGFSSFKTLSLYLDGQPIQSKEFAMMGFELKNTLSSNGFVSRAICAQDENHFLKSIVEKAHIGEVNGAVVTRENGHTAPLDGGSIVSLNMWGFTPVIFAKLEEMFKEFSFKNKNDNSKEFFLPSCINEIISADHGRVKVIKSNENWFGLTYKEDKQLAISRINKLVEQGVYPSNLFA